MPWGVCPEARSCCRPPRRRAVRAASARPAAAPAAPSPSASCAAVPVRRHRYRRRRGPAKSSSTSTTGGDGRARRGGGLGRETAGWRRRRPRSQGFLHADGDGGEPLPSAATGAMARSRRRRPCRRGPSAARRAWASGRAARRAAGRASTAPCAGQAPSMPWSPTSRCRGTYLGQMREAASMLSNSLAQHRRRRGSARYGQRPTSMRSTAVGSAGLSSESPSIQAGDRHPKNTGGRRPWTRTTAE